VNPTAAFSRYSLGQFPTPLHRLHRLEQALGGGHLMVKRDDLAGFAVAGNKTRPLEFLIGDALTCGAEVVVSGGAPKSNFASALAAATRSAGLECELMVPGGKLDDPPVPLAMAIASGATLRFTGGDREELDTAIDERVRELAAAGRRAYAVPRGGACAVGALGFANAACELAEQGVPDDAAIVLPVGSGASVAGLIAGRAAVGAGWSVAGVSVSRPIDEMHEQTSSIAAACSRSMLTAEPHDALLVDATVPGMAAVTEGERVDALLAFDTEGLLFDPSYGVKALHHALTMIRQGSTEPIILWHTGGLTSAIPLIAREGAS
jgi:D-cysteine desulfhydrase